MASLSQDKGVREENISHLCAAVDSQQPNHKAKKITECGDKLEAVGEETAGDRWPAAKN